MIQIRLNVLLDVCHIANAFLYVFTLCYLHCFEVLNPMTHSTFSGCS